MTRTGPRTELAFLYDAAGDEYALWPLRGRPPIMADEPIVISAKYEATVVKALRALLESRLPDEPVVE